MSIHPPTETISLTIVLKRAEFEMAIGHGIEYLHVLAHGGHVKPHMPWPKTPEVARDLAILGVQEILSGMAHQRRSEHLEDDEIPF
ncbi:hypothetical protein HKCCE4037_19135 [Rhodobacterales bacterium HKCCE4037]|nr:hypothetical protein [Rhodobacterales bacterium HKCCE4037]